MDFRGFNPLQTTEFGGWNTFFENVQLVPPPFSPFAYNVQFRRGGTRTRPGFTARVGHVSGAIPLSIKDYTLLNTTQRRVLALDSAGVLTKYVGATYAPEVITGDLFDAASGPYLQMVSHTVFGREYIGISKTVGDIPGVGYHVPMAYDDVNLDPVAPAGPAYAPHVVEGAASSAGPQSIAAGTHFYRVCYRTRNGFITPPGPLQLHVSDGGNQVTITKVWPGPDYVVGRIIVATPTNNPGDYFFIPGKMEIGDNVTTTISFDFSDPELINATAISVRSDPSSDLLNCVSLGEQAGCVVYHDRVGWFGGRAGFRPVGDQWPKNLAFDGGFQEDDPINAIGPAGWQMQKHHNGDGFSQGGPDGRVGQGLTITGDGANASIMQAIRTPSPDALTFNLLAFPTGRDIKVRMRVRKLSDAADPAAIVMFIAPVSTSPTLPASYASIGGDLMSKDEWRWLDATLILAADTLQADFAQNTVFFATTGAGLVGTPLPVGEQFYVDRIEFFVAGQEYEPSTFRWSRSQQPDAYDDLIGRQLVGAEDGQRITGGFVIGDSCYIVKEHSIYVTRDDGANEPGFWNVSAVSPTKGSEAVKGVALGERWAVIASRSGLHLFDGAAAHSVSSDIFRTWERINWAAASKVFVLVDPDNNRLFVGVPLDAETEAKHLLVLEYLGGSFTTGGWYLGDTGETTRWSLWEIVDGSFSSATVYHRPDGIRDVLFAAHRGTDPWDLLAIDEVSKRDTFAVGDPQGIVTKYRLPYDPQGDGRHSWGAFTANVWGQGTLKIVGYLPDGVTLVTEGNRGITPVALDSTPKGDYEWLIDVTSERMSWEFQTSELDSWFALNRVVQYLKQKPYSGLRGQRKVA